MIRAQTSAIAQSRGRMLDVVQPAATISIDWSFAALLTGVLALLAFAPTVFGYMLTPPDKWFSGIAGNVHDTAQYLSWMRESGSRLLIENKLTSEPNPPIYLNLHWWIAGRIGALLDLSLIQSFHLFHLASIPLYVAVAYGVCHVLCRDRTRTRFALLLATFGSGFGWVWVLEKLLYHHQDVQYPLDVYTTQGNTLQVATISPHQLLALTLTLGVLTLGWLGYEFRRWSLTAAATALALFLGLGHVYDLVIIWAVLCMYGLLAALRHGFAWRRLAHLAIIVVGSAPAPLYFGWVSSSANPIWQRAFAQYDNLGVHTPPPAHLVILLGLPLVVSLVAVASRIRRFRALNNRDLLLVAWLVINLPIAYLPLHFEIMLLSGIQMVSAVLTTDVIFDDLIPRLTTLRASTKQLVTAMPHLLPAAFLLLVIPTNVYLLGWRMNELSRGTYPFYLSRGDFDAMRSLEASRGGDDVVLSAFETGHYIPGLTGARAFLSNAVMTVDFFQKRALVDAFFSDRADDGWREAMLREYHITYVLFGPAERALGSYEPGASALFSPIFIEGSTVVFRVNTLGSQGST